jgi:cyclopropane-fatty-acyl-phospholipid synthase
MLTSVLHRLVKIGRLTVIGPDGSRQCFGETPDGGTRLDVTVRLKGRLTPWKLALRPDLALGEAYVDGSLLIERGTLWDLLDLLGRNAYFATRRPNALVRATNVIRRRLHQSNPLRAARRNAAHHYDLSYELFRSFLDDDMQYSCAYFTDPNFTLDQAQRAKKRHIIAKLLLRPGQRVLDIGCGWGGLALYLAEIAGARVTGITLSQEQYQRAQSRALERGRTKDATFRLIDYRDVEGRFDRIVSVGMFEHVGVGFYDTFFKKCANLLADDGIALLHAIGRSTPPGITNPWIAKYIFPGGYIPALSEVLPTIERAGLTVTDVEILQLHYAETLKAWRERFLAHRDEVGRLYDQRFVRMWEFYLTGSEMAFREGDMVVFQIQMAKRKGLTPATRDYIAQEEAHLRANETGYATPLRLAGE